MAKQSRYIFVTVLLFLLIISMVTGSVIHSFILLSVQPLPDGY